MEYPGRGRTASVAIRHMSTDNVPDLLVRLYITMSGVYTNAARSVGLTPQQAEIICRLALSRPSLGELAEATNTSPKNMTGLVDRLVARGDLEAVLLEAGVEVAPISG